MAKKPLRVPQKELDQFNANYKTYLATKDEFTRLSISQKQLAQALEVCFSNLTQAENDLNSWTAKWEEAFGTDAEVNIETGEVNLPANAKNK